MVTLTTELVAISRKKVSTPYIRLEEALRDMVRFSFMRTGLYDVLTHPHEILVDHAVPLSGARYLQRWPRCHSQ